VIGGATKYLSVKRAVRFDAFEFGAALVECDAL